MTGATRRRTRLLASFLALCALLSACATGGIQGSGNAAERRAESLARAGSHADAAALYIDLATRAGGNERDRLTLLAAEQWLDAGDAGRARNALRDMRRPPAGESRWLWSSNLAALALWDGRPDEALGHLEPLSREALPLRYRSRIEALRADAWFQKGNPARAVELYLQRENWLDGARRIELNRERLWAGLKVSDPETLQRAALSVSDSVLRGWLTLGALAASTGQQGIAWVNGVARWKKAHREHPANALLAGMQLPERESLEFPRQIALLLPLSGRNAAAGSAVRNGFLGAYFSQVRELEEEQRIVVYDMAGSNDARATYDEAVADGADFVVGPLLRPQVVAVLRDALPAVPTLALNYLPPEIPAPPGVFQFALAPEDEATAAATRALADGHQRALALVPNNDWGRRVLQSFADSLEGAGGRLLDFRRYEPSTRDFSFEIEGLMALTGSVERYQRLRANIGGPLQFDPRRRQDADFVFLAADAKAGRLLKSQLKFHYAGDLPVYSTSYIYSMDGRSDSDLNGVMFSDAPWVVAPPAWVSGLPDLYEQYWPDEKRLARLHAMGYDAYRLVGELYGARTSAMPEIPGVTGRLYLDEEGRIHRRLAWAEFRRGRPVALQPRPEALPGPGELDREAAPGESEWPISMRNR